MVESYVESAEPIGSRFLARNFDLGVSPATVRNTMMDLEEMGLLCHPHTSAGRVPTDEGYRYYVEHLMESAPLGPTETRLVEDRLTLERSALDGLYASASRLLAVLSHEMGVALAPWSDDGVLGPFACVAISRRKLLLVLGLRGGLPRTTILDVAAEIDPADLRRAEEILNERLAGTGLRELRRNLEERLDPLVRAENPLLEELVRVAPRLLASLEAQDWVFLGGTTNLVSQPEFREPSRLTGILGFLEATEDVGRFLHSRGTRPGLEITIGGENPVEAMRLCSIVTLTYEARGVRGTVGILGPTRMPYMRVVAAVRHVGERVQRFLEEEVAE
jgi:heat-inducible transcriptional repressor